MYWFNDDLVLDGTFLPYYTELAYIVFYFLLNIWFRLSDTSALHIYFFPRVFHALQPRYCQVFPAASSYFLKALLPSGVNTFSSSVLYLGYGSSLDIFVISSIEETSQYFFWFFFSSKACHTSIAARVTLLFLASEGYKSFGFFVVKPLGGRNA